MVSNIPNPNASPFQVHQAGRTVCETFKEDFRNPVRSNCWPSYAIAFGRQVPTGRPFGSTFRKQCSRVTSNLCSTCKVPSSYAINANRQTNILLMNGFCGGRSCIGAAVKSHCNRMAGLAYRSTSEFLHMLSIGLENFEVEEFK